MTENAANRSNELSLYKLWEGSGQIPCDVYHPQAPRHDFGDNGLDVFEPYGND